MCLNMRHNRWPTNRFWPFYNIIWCTWYLRTRLQKNFRYSMIWFVSFGEITDMSRISQAQSAGTQSKSFVPPPNLGCQMDVQRGVPPLAQALTHFHSPWNSLFISPTPSLMWFIHFFVFVLFSAVRCLVFLVPSSPVSVCHLDLFFFVTLIFISANFPTLWGVTCFYKPAEVSLCDQQFSVLFKGTNKLYLNLT